MTNGLTFQNDAVAALLRASEAAIFPRRSIGDLSPKAARPFIPPTNLTRLKPLASVPPETL